MTLTLLTTLLFATPQVTVTDSTWVADLLAADSIQAPQLNSDRYAYSLTLPLTNHGYIPEYTAPTIADEIERQKADSARVDACLPRFAEPYERQLARDAERINAQFFAINGNPRLFRFARNADYVIPSVDMSQFTVESTIIGTQLTNVPAIIADNNLAMDDLVPELKVKTDRWHWKGDHSVQMSQTSLSNNWYNGGDNNLTVNSLQRINVNRYDENKKTTFEIDMSLKLSGYYTETDTLHKMKVSDNEFTINVKYGYKAFKKWYYTIQTYAKTQLFDFYPSNSNQITATWLSPLDVNVAAGLDYQYVNPKETFKFSLLLAPFSYNLRYVNDPRVDVTRYGIDEDKHASHSIGSTATVKMDWTITNWLKWSSRLYYFTSYEDVLVEFENTLNIALGRLFSARLYYYPRFDDKIDDRVETKEILTFGFNYAW